MGDAFSAGAAIYSSEGSCVYPISLRLPNDVLTFSPGNDFGGTIQVHRCANGTERYRWRHYLHQLRRIGVRRRCHWSGADSRQGCRQRSVSRGVVQQYLGLLHVHCRTARQGGFNRAFSMTNSSAATSILAQLQGPTTGPGGQLRHKSDRGRRVGREIQPATSNRLAIRWVHHRLPLLQ